jgi:hypothetical protein
LSDFGTVNDLYEEILDSFVSNGCERRPRPPRSSAAPAWSNFVSDEDQSVRDFLVLLISVFYFSLRLFRRI